VVQFVDALPKSGSGKVMWRAMQEEQDQAQAKTAAAAAAAAAAVSAE
jgi:fatty-acyl-CoA synthase